MLPRLDNPNAPAPSVEALVLGLMLGLGAVMIPPWARVASAYGSDFLVQMAGPLLLPALAFAWVLTCGGLDLSVWVLFYLGSVLTARLMLAGFGPAAALAAATACGLAVGALHAAAVRWGRLPSWGITGAVAILGVSAVAALSGNGILKLDNERLNSWPAADNPLLLVGAFYAIAMIAGISLSRRLEQAPKPSQLAVGLVVSAVLSSWGGMCWTVKEGLTPQPGHLLGDLRVPVAALLTGALVFRGPSRTLLAGVLCPTALLLAGIWRERVPVWPMRIEQANLALLVALLAGFSLAVRRLAAQRASPWPAMAMLTGIVVCGLAVWHRPPQPLSPFLIAGLAIFVLALAAMIRAALRPRPGDT